MYLVPKVRQLTSEEITPVETHSPKSLNKNPPGTPNHCTEWTPNILHWKNHWCLPAPHRQKTEHVYGTTRTSYDDTMLSSQRLLLPNLVKIPSDTNNTWNKSRQRCVSIPVRLKTMKTGWFCRHALSSSNWSAARVCEWSVYLPTGLSAAFPATTRL